MEMENIKVYPRPERDIMGLTHEQMCEAVSMYTEMIKDKIIKEVAEEYRIDITDTDDDSVVNLIKIFMDKAITEGMKMVADKWDVVHYYNDQRVAKKPELVVSLDYGWLSPTGEFINLATGYHSQYAQRLIEDRDWVEEFRNYDRSRYSDDMGVYGDFLSEVKGYILLHNPSGGTAIVTMSERCRMTKAQKEFIFDYFIKRDRKDLAMQYFND